MNAIIEFFKNLDVYEWIIIGAILLAVVLLVVLIVRGVSKSKKKKAAKAAQNQQTEQSVIEAAEEQQSPVEQAKPETEEQSPVEQAKPEAKADEVDDNALEEELESEASIENTVEKQPEPVKPVEATEKQVTKVYHISKQKQTGKWQVKASKSAKAVKLFTTQLAAIDFAKKLAANQDARIVIHKEDGSFRKLTYHSRKY